MIRHNHLCVYMNEWEMQRDFFDTSISNLTIIGTLHFGITYSSKKKHSLKGIDGDVIRHRRYAIIVTSVDGILSFVHMQLDRKRIQMLYRLTVEKRYASCNSRARYTSPVLKHTPRPALQCTPRPSFQCISYPLHEYVPRSLYLYVPRLS